MYQHITLWKSKLIHFYQRNLPDIFQDFSSKFLSFLSSSVLGTGLQSSTITSPNILYFHKKKPKENITASVTKTGISFKILLLIYALKQSGFTAWNPNTCWNVIYVACMYMSYMLLFYVLTFCSEQKEHSIFFICYTFQSNDEHFYGGIWRRKWSEKLKVETKVMKLWTKQRGKKSHNSGFIVWTKHKLRNPTYNYIHREEKKR